MSWEFMLTPDDIVPIKTPFSNPSTVNVTVSEIISYGIDNNLGNAFMLIFDNPNGCMIRYFNVNGDTAYLATANYINDNAKIGIGEATNIQTIAATGVYCNNPWATPVTFGFASVAFNFITKVVNGITYDTQGGYSMGAYHAIYVPPTVTNIYIDGNPLVSHTWSSVSNITGKGGKKYRLTDILNINDGNAVNNVAAKNNVDFSKKTKVNTLIDSVIPVVEDVTKAIVSFDIPSSNYGFIKLVYKENDIPTSIDDGTVKNLDVDDNTATITGLEENTTYYFMIFTNKSESEPYRYKTGEIPVPEGKWVETISTCKATDDNFSMSFNESTEQWKVNQSGATDEWVWLRNLGDYTLTTSSKTPAEVFASSSVLTAATLNPGSNPVRVMQDTNTYFSKRWDLDYTNWLTSEPQGKWSDTSWYGLRTTLHTQLGSGYGYTGYALATYGIDLLIAVNHATMQARAIWLLFTNAQHNAITICMENSANAGEYMSLCKFF